jgi:topoisomerase-4 subunit B
MGFGNTDRDRDHEDANRHRVRDYGRGIPLGKLMECAAQINTGAKYDSEVFKRSVGLNGVGIKAVNALSEFFEIQAIREKSDPQPSSSARALVVYDMGKPKAPATSRRHPHRLPGRHGELRRRHALPPRLRPRDAALLLVAESQASRSFCSSMARKASSPRTACMDLIRAKLTEQPQYPDHPPRLAKMLRVAFTHGTGYGEEYYSFVNGQHTTQGGTHQAALP